MKKLIHSLPAKVTAIILVTLIFILTAASLSATAYMVYRGYYVKSFSEVYSNALEEQVESRLWDMYYFIIDENQLPPAQGEDDGFYYRITDTDGTVLASTYENSVKTVSHFSQEFWMSNQDAKEAGLNVTSSNNSVCLIFHGYVSSFFNDTDAFYATHRFVNLLHSWRYAAIVLSLLGIIAIVALLVFLYSSAGRHRDISEPCLNWVDKIPFDLYTAIVVAVIFSIFLFIDSNVGDVEEIVMVIAIIPVMFLILLGYTMSFATRIKVGGLIRSTIIYRVLTFVFKNLARILKRIWNIISEIYHSIPLMWKVAVILVASVVVELIVMAAFGFDSSDIFFIWAIDKVFFVPAAIVAASSFYRLKKGSEKIASGDLEYRVNTYNMWGDFKQFGENLSSISTGMSHAVDERMKSEHFKTELITNVSHDIKTPLTSIINYVDLIKKEQPQDEKISEYIAVLERQSARLKKLIEDLVEASKASTGNISIDMAPCEVGVLLEQAVGEYQQRLINSKIEPVLTVPPKPIKIMADGRRLWRVFDNLLCNVCKYAQPGTRLYLTLEQSGNQARIIFRNISHTELNISGDELLERFVRGDSSRNTEGSGLGLSIAQSLVELQKGKLDLVVDGDLFKVILTFETI